MPPKKTVEELLRQLEMGEISSDGEESDDDDFDYYPNREELEEELSQQVSPEEDNIFEHIIDAGNNEQDTDPPLVCDSVSISSDPVPGPSIMAYYKRDLVWKVDNLKFDEQKIEFTGATDLPEILLQLKTPYDFFTYYFTNDLFQHILQETTKYSIQKNPDKVPDVTLLDLRKYIGILIFMSVYHYPSVRSYWGKFGFAAIKETMTNNKFERIRRILHFNDNEKHLDVNHPKHDRLHKLRPIIGHLNDKFASIPLDQRLSIDKQMCATKIGHFLKQYLPNKPHKWGFKLFMLCSLLRYAYRFLIYSGKETERLPDEPDLGPTAQTVIILSRIIPRRQNHIVYFDNFYTSIPLMIYMAQQGIQTLGTIQRNRLGKTCKLSTKEQMSKVSVARGTFEENVASVSGIDISAVACKDNKPVVLASTYVGAEPVQSVQRFDKKEKKQITITCPKLVKEYNAHMGGVDLMDSYLGRYRIRMKSRKWYMRIFYHLVDLTVINSWVLYKIVATKNKENPKSIMNLVNFRSELADSLCKCEPPVTRGRPSTSSPLQPAAKRRRGCQVLPSRDVRLDGINHDNKVGESRMRCMLPGCNLLSVRFCSKCKVYLCTKKNKDCFNIFHKTSDF